jgi:membrane dipeptidase
VPEGLNEFGRSVVRAMNELGMVVDVSHAGERSFFDALEASSKPVIASHSGCKAIHGHQRNLTDDQLRALAQHGGVVGMVFCTSFLDAQAQLDEKQLRESDEYKAIAGANDSEQFVKQSDFLARSARPLSIERLIDHLCHAVEIAGVDHVGIGSDFDGIQRTPRGLEDASCYGAIADAMLQRGFSLDEARAVLGGNMQRVFASVTGSDTAAWSAALAPID